MNGDKHETLLTIQSAALWFGQTPILRDITATVKNIEGHGQVVALLGPSGVGKTKLFLACAGLQALTRGYVAITEKQLPVQPGMVGVVFQNYPLFDHRTVFGNLTIAAGQKMHQKLTVKQRVQAIAERFQLDEHLDKYPDQLSGGQRQRVAIARQLLCSEHYLLMDEPFTGLDPLMKQKTCALINEVAEQDELNTFIITTHDIDSALCVADTIWIMGRDRDEAGKSMGARIQMEIDLIARGLAWHPQLQHSPEFNECVKEITEKFKTL